jgi:Flp pilus assembly protein TadD
VAEPVPAVAGVDAPFLDALRRTDGDSEKHDEAVVHLNQGHTAADAREWSRAIQEYGAAARLVPDDAVAQYNFGLALHKRGDDRVAIDTFRKAIALAPDEPLFHLPLAAALEAVGENDDAIGEYRTFLASKPNVADGDKVRGRIDALSSAAARNQ